jgi:hypothetical protein
MRAFLPALTFLIVGGFAATVTAASPELWIPSNVNAVARVKVAEIYKSELARKEGWLKKATESFVQQEAFIPPGTDQIVIGAELDLANHMRSIHKYSVLVPDSQLTLEKLAPWFPNGIEKISGKSVVQFGNDGFVADVGDGCWLVSDSLSRQVLARWMRIGQVAGGNVMPAYLSRALSSKDNAAAHVLMVIDLQDNFTDQGIKAELKDAGWFKGESNLDSATKVLESVRGITIGMTVDKERTGTVTVEFGKETSILAPVLPKLVEAVLGRVGASSDEILSWKWTAKGNTITGTGAVSPGGARRLLSILEPPSLTNAIASESESAGQSAGDLMAKTSLKYSKSVRVLLDDLGTKLEDFKRNPALYFERYARKMDDLPQLNVDPVLLDFGAKVSRSLRYQEQAVRMNNLNATTRQSYNVSGYADGIAYGNQIIGAESNQAKKGVQFSEMKQIEEGFLTVRRAMTEKYKIEF